MKNRAYRTERNGAVVENKRGEGSSFMELQCRKLEKKALTVCTTSAEGRGKNWNSRNKRYHLLFRFQPSKTTAATGGDSGRQNLGCASAAGCRAPQWATWADAWGHQTPVEGPNFKKERARGSHLGGQK